MKTKIVAVGVIVTMLILSLPGCAPKEPPLSSAQSSQSESEDKAPQSPEPATELDVQNSQYTAQAGSYIVFGGATWIDETRIMVCEHDEDATLTVSIIDSRNGHKLFEHAWTDVDESNLISFSNGNTAFVVNGPDVLRIDCESYSVSESTLKYYEEGMKVAATGWAAIPGNPLKLMPPGNNSDSHEVLLNDKACLLTEYSAWSPNGEYLLVVVENEAMYTSGPADLLDVEFAIINTQGEAVCSFVVQENDGKSVKMVWTDTNSLLVYRTKTETNEVTFQEFFPSIMEYTEETTIDGSVDAVSGHAGAHVSLLYESETGGSEIVVFWRDSGNRVGLTIPTGCNLRVSPKDEYLLAQTDTSISVRAIQ